MPLIATADGDAGPQLVREGGDPITEPGVIDVTGTTVVPVQVLVDPAQRERALDDAEPSGGGKLPGEPFARLASRVPVIRKGATTNSHVVISTDRWTPRLASSVSAIGETPSPLKATYWREASWSTVTVSPTPGWSPSTTRTYRSVKSGRCGTASRPVVSPAGTMAMSTSPRRSWSANAASTGRTLMRTCGASSAIALRSGRSSTIVT